MCVVKCGEWIVDACQAKWSNGGVECQCLLKVSISETILDNKCDNGETESENQEPDAGRAAVDAAEVCGDREEGAGAEGERPGREQGG